MEEDVIRQFVDRLIDKPTIAHLIRAKTRYGSRLGSQFAAAITYFSVLAMVPILMFAFSMVGMTLTLLRPDWLGRVKSLIAAKAGSSQFDSLIDSYLTNWRAVGIIGVLSLLYAGSGWVGNLRSAVRAQWRPEFEFDANTRNPVVTILANTGVLMVLLVGVALSFGISSVGTSLTDLVAARLGLENSTGGELLLRATAVLLTFISGWFLFLVIYWLLPAPPAPRAARIKGAAIAALALTVLQLSAGLLMAQFAKNQAAALFGPVIVLMLVLNLFGQIALFVAAWIATANQPAVAFHWNRADQPLRDRDDVELAAGHWQRADDEHQQQQAAQASRATASKSHPRALPARPAVGTLGAARPLRVEAERTAVAFNPAALDANGQPPTPDPDVMVSQEVAARSVSVSAVAGYTVGAATGIGLGALIASGLATLIKPKLTKPGRKS